MLYSLGQLTGATLQYIIHFRLRFKIHLTACVKRVERMLLTASCSFGIKKKKICYFSLRCLS